MNDLILTLDPGSLRTGWCVMGGPEQLLQAGVLLPDKQAAGSEFRIHRMCEDLRLLLAEWQPKTILIEYASGKINPRRHHGSGQGLQIHGISIGRLWGECVAWWRLLPTKQQLQTKIVLIAENDWTRGVPKVKRQAAVAQMFPQYKPQQDPGGDLADAISLSIYYHREQTVRLAECLK